MIPNTAIKCVQMVTALDSARSRHQPHSPSLHGRLVDANARRSRLLLRLAGPLLLFAPAPGLAQRDPSERVLLVGRHRPPYPRSVDRHLAGRLTPANGQQPVQPQQIEERVHRGLGAHVIRAVALATLMHRRGRRSWLLQQAALFGRRLHRTPLLRPGQLCRGPGRRLRQVRRTIIGVFGDDFIRGGHQWGRRRRARRCRHTEGFGGAETRVGQYLVLVHLG